MKTHVLFAWWSSLFVGLLFPANLQAQNARRVDLTSAEIAAVLRQIGFVAEPEDVQLPEDLTTATDHPGIHLTQVESLADGRLRVRFACRSQVECQPFATLVRLSSEKQGTASPQLSHSVAEPDRTQAEPGRHLLVRPGQQVTLLMEDNHMRISIPALVIDSGAAQERIRLTSLDRRTMFRGIVMSTDIVQGALP